MNKLSWNRGLEYLRKVRGPGDLLKVRKPDFLFVSETIVVANKIKDDRVHLSFAQCFAVDRIGHSGGLAVFWKQHV